jgi:hypothetical protein
MLSYVNPDADTEGEVTEAAVEPYWETDVGGYVARIQYLHDPVEDIQFSRCSRHDDLDAAYQWLQEYGIEVDPR